MKNDQINYKVLHTTLSQYFYYAGDINDPDFPKPNYLERRGTMVDNFKLRKNGLVDLGNGIITKEEICRDFPSEILKKQIDAYLN